MSDNRGTLVICKLSNCFYWEPAAESQSRCLCQHPDKQVYMRTDPCPLYRLDWKRKKHIGG